jgi:hypothetical protein
MPFAERLSGMTRAVVAASIALAACASEAEAVQTLVSSAPDASDAAPPEASADVSARDAAGEIDSELEGAAADVTPASDASDGAANPVACPMSLPAFDPWGKCGVERWSVKTGIDAQASAVSLVPTAAKVAELTSLAKPATLPDSSRLAPTELATFELRNVTITTVKLEDDGDYHIVLNDGPDSLIAEIPHPWCVGMTSPFSCFVPAARKLVADAYAPTSTPQHPNAVATVIGVAFFDFLHGQTGLAPNGIELHPILAICLGENCDPRAR